MSQPNGQRLAAIDIGTNSTRLIVAETKPAGGFRVIDDEKVVTRLGRGWAKSGRLSAEAMERTALAVARMKAIADGYPVQLLRAVATCAVREASNGGEFVDLVRNIAGLEVEVLDGLEEAKLAFRSVSQAFDLRNLDAAVADIGGGSTEVVLSASGRVERVITLPLGAVRLTERFDCSDRIDADRYRQLRRYIKRKLQRLVGEPPLVPQLLIGTGGSFTTLAAISIEAASSGQPTRLLPFTVRGHEMHRNEVKHLMDMLVTRSLRERSKVAGLSPERADIMVAGLAIVDGLLKHFKTNRLQVHDQGLRGGLLLSMVDQLHPESKPTAAAVDPLEAARQFAKACHCDMRHADQVAAVALMCFDQMVEHSGASEAAWATPACRQLLAAAAVMHEVGYAIQYAKHHQHSYHLIIYSDLSGFTRRELEVVANVARYHRRAKPKKKHHNFAKLSSSDQKVVRHLAAILRVANGLDRGHGQMVKSLTITCQEGIAQIQVEAEREPLVDLWGAERKADLFEKVFRLRARFSWRTPGPPVEPKVAATAVEDSAVAEQMPSIDS